MPLFASAKACSPNRSDPAFLDSEEPRWPAIIALLASAGASLSLPEKLSLGPKWLPIVCVAFLLVPTVLSHRFCNHKLNFALGNLVTGLVTLFTITSVCLLVRTMIYGGESATALLRSAGILWVCNVLIFAVWYWRLDAGGPHARDLRDRHANGAFLFPQMSMSPDEKAMSGDTNWSPNFWDYLFLAFNTSTALSPTDTAVLSRWAKVIMMVQALLSLAIVALLAARAVNVLGSPS